MRRDLPVDKLTVDAVVRPAIREARTIALAVVPGKRDEWSLLPEPRRCEDASRMGRNDSRPGEICELPSGHRILGSW